MLLVDYGAGATAGQYNSTTAATAATTTTVNQINGTIWK